MSVPIQHRMAVLPDVGRADLAERALALGAARLHDEGQLVDGRRAMPRLPREAGIVGVGHRLEAQEEVVDMDAMERTLILFGVLGAHEEFAGWDQREFWTEVRRHGRVKRIAHRAFRLHFRPMRSRSCP